MEPVLEQVPDSVDSSVTLKALRFLITWLAYGLGTGHYAALLFLLKKGLEQEFFFDFFFL